MAWPAVSPRAVLGFGAALAIVGLAVSTAVFSVRTADLPFTQLWAVPSRDGQTHVLQIGVRNYEGRGEEYRVTVEDTGGLIADWQSIALGAGEEWSGRLGLESLPEEPLRVMLYRQGAAATAYRWLDVWPASFLNGDPLPPGSELE